MTTIHAVRIGSITDDCAAQRDLRILEWGFVMRQTKPRIASATSLRYFGPSDDRTDSPPVPTGTMLRWPRSAERSLA